MYGSVNKLGGGGNLDFLDIGKCKRLTISAQNIVLKLNDKSLRSRGVVPQNFRYHYSLTLLNLTSRHKRFSPCLSTGNLDVNRTNENRKDNFTFIVTNVLSHFSDFFQIEGNLKIVF